MENESEVLNVIVKARPSVIDFKGSINKRSNKANFVRWSSKTVNFFLAKNHGCRTL